MRNRNVEQASIRSRDNDLMARTIPFLPPALAAVDEGRMGRTEQTAQEVRGSTP